MMMLVTYIMKSLLTCYGNLLYNNDLEAGSYPDTLYDGRDQKYHILQRADSM